VADDQRSGEPPYRVIASDLRARIEAGEFRPGDALPSITRLSQEYGVAKTTAQKALQVLKDEGLARGVQGWGTIVADRK
jgi:DNA-binding GntR family transcriptional regulator